MAAQREGDDLPARCILLLEEVKDLIEAQKNESSGTRSEPQASTSSLVLQVQQRDQSHAEFSVAICTVSFRRRIVCKASTTEEVSCLFSSERDMDTLILLPRTDKSYQCAFPCTKNSVAKCWSWPPESGFSLQSIFHRCQN